MPLAALVFGIPVYDKREEQVTKLFFSPNPMVVLKMPQNCSRKFVCILSRYL